MSQHAAGRGGGGISDAGVYRKPGGRGVEQRLVSLRFAVAAPEGSRQHHNLQPGGSSDFGEDYGIGW